MSWIVAHAARLLAGAKDEPGPPDDDNGSGPVDHLSVAELRALVKVLLADKTAGVKTDTVRGTVPSSTFSDWKNGKSNSVKTTAAVREYLNGYYKNKELPEAYRKPDAEVPEGAEPNQPPEEGGQAEEKSPVDALTLDQLRGLVNELLDDKNSGVSAKDIYGDAITSSTFSKWKTGKSNSVNTTKIVRAFLAERYKNKPLPEKYRPGAKKDPAEDPPAKKDPAEDPPAEKDPAEDPPAEKDPAEDPPAADDSAVLRRRPPPDLSEQPEQAPAPGVDVSTEPDPTFADYERINLCSWNVLKYSYRNTSEEKKRTIYNVITNYDVIALQEVTGDIASARRDGLLSIRLKDYSIAQSPELFRPSNTAPGKEFKERLLFFYKTDLFDEINKTVLQADMMRQPFLVTLRHKPTGYLFSVITVHLIFGVKTKTKTQKGVTQAESMVLRRAEAAQVVAWTLKCAGEKDTYGEVFLCGDFNLSPNDYCFFPLRRAGYFMSNPDTETTESSIYDTFWFPVASTNVEPDLSQVVPFASQASRNNKRALKMQKKGKSDHNPVSIALEIGVPKK